MKLPDKINTVVKFKQVSYKEKGSEFIAQIFHSENEQEIVDNLKKIKKKYYDASHYCYAFKLLNDKIKYSDDGEPSGTGGKRILNALEHFNLQNQFVVVIRYFGGIKLGVGALGKAYYKAAFNVISQSKVLLKELYQEVVIRSKFNNLSYIQRIMIKDGAKIEKTEYKDDVMIKCLIKPSKLKIIENELTEVGKGKILYELTGNSYYL